MYFDEQIDKNERKIEGDRERSMETPCVFWWTDRDRVREQKNRDKDHEKGGNCLVLESIVSKMFWLNPVKNCVCVRKKRERKTEKEWLTGRQMEISHLLKGKRAFEI